MARNYIFILLFVCGSAGAVTQAEVMAGAKKLYNDRISELRSAHRLDTDEHFGERIGRLAGRLIAQAGRDYPESGAWEWEVHTTNDGDANAFAMAGGKILVSSQYVTDLSLNDAELSMLLAHEISHATLRHNLKEFEEALRLDPSWAAKPFAEFEDAIDNDNTLMRKLASFNSLQEEEADREGMRLAWRAGWPPTGLANYFRKMARNSHLPNFDSPAHPAPSRRWRAARELAAELAKDVQPAKPD